MSSNLPSNKKKSPVNDTTTDQPTNLPYPPDQQSPKEEPQDTTKYPYPAKKTSPKDNYPYPTQKSNGDGFIHKPTTGARVNIKNPPTRTCRCDRKGR